MRTAFPMSRALALLLLALSACAGAQRPLPDRKPNILFLLADQWRAQSLGYAGDPDVKTPHLDRLAAESVDFANAVSGMPVCCPFRGSLLTGRRPLTHGVFMNDVPLPDKELTIAEVLGREGYDTGYIGKWHLDGQGRSNFTPPERRQGFRYWKALECTHDYNNSIYYADTREKLKWEGYDTFSQTRDAQRYLRERAKGDRPFFLFLAWGTPHAPYHTAPKRYRDLYDPAKITLRPNVPESMRERARRDLAGYYAHCTAIDDRVGDLRKTLEETGLAEDTIIVFTSDHGDLIGSHGAYKKQQPYEESVRVPMLLHYPRLLGTKGRKVDPVMNSEDIMPTLLGLCGVAVPDTVEGLDYGGFLRGGRNPFDGATVITCVQPFGQWNRVRHRGREYRGVVTTRYTYTRDLGGPWLLFDNEKDPYQQDNLIGKPAAAGIQRNLDGILWRKLEENGDEFLPGPFYLKKWSYPVNATGTVPYTR